MDLLSIFGVLLGFAAILGGNALEGGHLDGLVNAPAAIIVMGGTVGAALLQTPWPVMKRALQIYIWIFKPPKTALRSGIEKIVDWSMTARKEGLLGLEKSAEEENDEFARKGLQLLVDGSEPEGIRAVMETEMFITSQRDTAAAKVYEGMGGYAPTIGIIGAVMGLIHVMSNLAEPEKLGSGIATAFVATIYGVALANLLFLPVANKLKGQVSANLRYQEMMVEGIISIAEGENPRSIELKLEGYLN